MFPDTQQAARYLPRTANEWAAQFAEFVETKGKVEPGKHRAYGYEPPSHMWDDIKLKWRDMGMRVGRPPHGSSPAEQQKMGLNQDVTLFAAKGEGEKLRDAKYDD